MRKHEDYMAVAVEMGKLCPGFPFGAVVVDRTTGDIIAKGVNDSRARGPLWHGEVVAIDNTSKLPKETVGNTPWRNLALYTTAEPCPMCQGAILWAGISLVVYGTSIPSLKKFGYEQIDIRCTELVAKTPERGCVLGSCEVVPGIMEEECDKLFESAKDHWGDT